MTIPSREEVREWDVDQVQKYLKQTGLSDCYDILMRKQVDGLALLGMNDSVLQLWSRDMKIMQIKKLSKLVSQLNTEVLPACSTSYSPAGRQRQNTVDRKVSLGSVTANDNDWGSDFEDTTDTVKTAKISVNQVFEATIDTSQVNRSAKITKISMNQVPKPYKPPSSNLKAEKVEYSNVKKASIALKKSAVSAKISRFSSQEEKPTTSKKPLTKNVDNSRSSIKVVDNSKSLIKKVENSKSSMKEVDNFKYSIKSFDNSKSSIKKVENHKSSIKEVGNSKSSITNFDNSKSSFKKVDNSKSSFKKVDNSKSSIKKVDNSKSSIKKTDNSKSSIPAKKSPPSAEVTKKINGTLNKDIKQSQLHSNGSHAKVEKQDYSVINKSKPTFVKSLQNQTKILPDNSKEKLPGALKVTFDLDPTPPLQKDVPSDKPTFIVHFDRSSQKKDCHVNVKESPVFSTATDAKDVKEASEEVCDVKFDNVKSSDTIVRNNTSYAMVKTSKVSSMVKSSEQHDSPSKASKFPHRALPLTPFEECANPGEKIISSPPPDLSMSSLPTIPTNPNTIWTAFSTSYSLTDTKQNIIAQNNINIPTSTNPDIPSTNIWNTSPQKTATPSTSSISHLSTYPWYQSIDRKRAEQLVKQMNRDGGFVVRDSKHGGVDSPYTLTVYNNNKVFNINIRIRLDGKMALGKEKLEENTYPSVVTMVEHHQLEPLKLTAGGSGTEHSKTTLNYWPKKMQL